jgi:hypothetical protein
MRRSASGCGRSWQRCRVDDGGGASHDGARARPQERGWARPQDPDLDASDLHASLSCRDRQQGVSRRCFTCRSALARDRHFRTLPQASWLRNDVATAADKTFRVVAAPAGARKRAPTGEAAAQGVHGKGKAWRSRCTQRTYSQSLARKPPSARSGRSGRAQARSYRRGSGARRPRQGQGVAVALHAALLQPKPRMQDAHGKVWT